MVKNDDTPAQAHSSEHQELAVRFAFNPGTLNTGDVLSALSAAAQDDYGEGIRAGRFEVLVGERRVSGSIETRSTDDPSVAPDDVLVVYHFVGKPETLEKLKDTILETLTPFREYGGLLVDLTVGSATEMEESSAVERILRAERHAPERSR